MSANLTALDRFYSNPRYSILLIATLLVAGLSALSVLPSREDPEITLRNATVLTKFPGASAGRVEALVSRVIEDKLREIPEISTISSRSKLGLSVISIELADTVYETDADLLWSEVRNKLKDIEGQLPQGSFNPQLDTTRGEAFTYIVALSMRPLAENNTDISTNDIILLNRFSKELNSRFVNVFGTEFVKNYGDPTEEITVSINPNATQKLALNAKKISQSIANSDAKISAGIINNSQQTMTLEVRGALDNIERIRNIPVSFANTERGNITQLGDIADIQRGINMPQDNLALVNGRYGIIVAARMQSSQQGGQWRDNIVQVINSFKQELPAQMQLETLFEQQRYTDERLGGLLNNVVTGFVLIIGILFLTLGWRSALIVSVSLPLTFLFALAAMRFNNLPIHQMSVTGLIVALGIMVDNAIVMTDTIARNMRKGQDRMAAVSHAVKHLWMPLLGSTLTTVLTFMPIILMPGAAGEFIGGIAWAVIFSLIGSYIISHTLVASLSGHFLASGSKSADTNVSETHNFFQDGLSFPRLSNAFNKTILFSIYKPKTTIALVLVFPLLGFIGAGKLPEQFFPPSDRDMLNLEVYLPMSSSSEYTLKTVKDIQALLASNKNILRADWLVGQSAPSFYYNLPERQDGNPFYAQAMLSFHSAKQANESIAGLQVQLDKNFPEAQIILRKLQQGPLSFSPVELRLMGPNIDQLKLYGEKFKLLALATQDVTHVRASLNDPVAKVWLDVDEQVAALQGLSLSDVARQFQSASSGLTNGSILEGSEQLNVRVKTQGIESANSSYLRDMLLSTQNSDTGLPFSSLGQIQVKPGQGVITRRNGERINTLEIYIRDDILPATVLKRLENAIQASSLQLPAGYYYSFGGEDENRDKAVGNLMASVGLVVILLVVTVVLAFNSFRLSAIVFSVAVLAAGLGLLSLTVSGYPFGFTAIIGLMGLIGLAINAAIVILSELKSSHDAMQGDKKAILNSVTSCSRHISSTTITTVMGFMPLILSGGGFWPPFAIVIAGGTVLTTLVSFYFVPAMFALQRK